ncbi:hypothetical protein HPP92_004140 [Vanilla planifolia]|uniref:Uncharacterized protein n=1 Tax=Vanilla planifolia TaxID=51239 RepID=A0A835VP63_VANPL|nr:hypothetical protein HPP92_004577 [Vanilla planifolia]KAG0504068.1 hypothetical protein HPP92_004140 [Vanilla planifolia]
MAVLVAAETQRCFQRLWTCSRFLNGLSTYGDGGGSASVRDHPADDELCATFKRQSFHSHATEMATEDLEIDT